MYKPRSVIPGPKLYLVSISCSCFKLYYLELFFLSITQIVLLFSSSETIFLSFRNSLHITIFSVAILYPLTLIWNDFLHFKTHKVDIRPMVNCHLSEDISFVL